MQWQPDGTIVSDMPANSPNQAYSDQNHVETGIGPTVDNIINVILGKIQNENFKGKVADVIVDPIATVVKKKLRPYVIAGAIMYTIVILLLIFIIYLLAVKKKK